MTQALDVQPRHRVLEIGTGSGYQCAVLSRLARFVYSVERYKSLLTEAEAKLKLLGVDNVFTRHGDGGQGWLEQAPFDRIMVTAASPHEPTELLKQLKPGGVLVAPVGRGSVQMLHRYTGQDDGSFRRESLCEVRFVPLVEGTAKEGEGRPTLPQPPFAFNRHPRARPEDRAVIRRYVGRVERAVALDPRVKPEGDGRAGRRSRINAARFPG